MATITESAKRDALERAGGWVCHWCGVSAPSQKPVCRCMVNVFDDCSAPDIPHVTFEFDHVYPLRRGGPNVASNIVVSCLPCNHRKSAKHPLVWIAELVS